MPAFVQRETTARLKLAGRDERIRKRRGKTLLRWEVQQPSLESLATVGDAASCQSRSRRAELVEFVNEELDLGPTNRSRPLLGGKTLACRDTLRAAAALGDIAALRSPIAAAPRERTDAVANRRADLLTDSGNR